MGIRVVPLSKLSPEEKYKKDHAKWLAREPKKKFKAKPKAEKPLVKTISLSSGGQIGNFNGDKLVSSYYELIE